MGRAGPLDLSNVAFPLVLAVLSEQAKDHLGLVSGSGNHLLPPQPSARQVGLSTNRPASGFLEASSFWKS